MNYHNLLGIAAILLSASVFIHSLKSANAFPQGPNVSSGNNPIANSIAICSNSYSSLFTNNTSQVFIVTDITKQHPSYPISLRLNNQDVWMVESGGSPGVFQFNSGLRVGPGDTLDCAHSGFRVMISGYYAH